MAVTAAPPPTVPGYVNSVVKRILRSPLHKVMSRDTMLLEFAGRKTAKRYTVAVRYVHDGSRIVCFTDSRWWVNLRGGSPVRMLIAGRWLSGVATPVEDRARVAQSLSAFLHTKPGDSKYYGVRRTAEGLPQPADIDAAAQYTTMVEIASAAGAPTA